MIDYAGYRAYLKVDERETSANWTEAKMRKTQQPRTMDAPMSEAVTRIVRIC